MQGRKKPGMKKRVMLYLLWLAFSVCFGYGAAQADAAAGLCKGTVVVPDREMSLEEGKKILEREGEEDNPVSFALWSERPGELMADGPGYGRVPAAVTKCFGRVGLACGDDNGPELFQDDEEGCLLAADLARRLFGSENVVGQTLCCGDRRVTIRGILRHSRGQVVLLAEKDSAETLNRLSVGGAGAAADDFLLRHGITGKRLALNYGALAAKLAAWLLLLFAGGYPLYRGWRMPKEMPDATESFCPRTRGLIRRLCLIAAGGIYLWLLTSSMGWGGSFSLSELLPTKWSDFAFWSRKWSEIMDALTFLLVCEKMEGEKRALSVAVAGIFFLLLAFWFYWRAVRRACRVSAGMLAALFFFHWAVLAALSMELGENAWALAAHRGIWLAAPLGLALGRWGEGFQECRLFFKYR